MNDYTRIILIIIGSAGVTFLTRLIPFLFFGNGKDIPGIILFIEKYMPGMIMTVLVIYCLKDLSLKELPASTAVVLASASVVLLHGLFKNALVSIFASTFFYMALVQSEVLEKLLMFLK